MTSKRFHSMSCGQVLRAILADKDLVKLSRSGEEWYERCATELLGAFGVSFDAREENATAAPIGRAMDRQWLAAQPVDFVCNLYFATFARSTTGMRFDEIVAALAPTLAATTPAKPQQVVVGIPETAVPFVRTAQDAYALAGAGNAFVAMAANMGAFNAPKVDVIDARATPPDPESLAGRARCLLLGQRIRQARRAAKKNLEDAADAMSTTIVYVSDIERSNVIPTDEQLQKLATLFGVSVEDLKR